MITRPRNLPQADPYFDSVVLLAPFSGEDGDTTSTDLSNEAHTMTFNANSVLDGDIRKFGFTSAKFDGTGDYVSIPDALSLSPVSSSFTVECDVRFNGDPTTDQHTFVGKWTGTGLQREWWVGYRNNKLNAFLSSNGSNGIFLADVVWDPAGDTWYHIAFVFDRELATNETRVYVDGTQVGSSNTTLNTYASFFNSTADVWVGGYDADTNDWMDGWIENVRITKGVARYTAAFTPPERAYPTVAAIPEPSIEQTLTFNAAYSHPSITISNGDRTMTQTTPAGSWMWGNGPQTDEKLRASGGKWMYEVVIDSMPSTSAFVGVGWGNGNKSGLSTVYAGNTNGGAQLIDDENGTLCRMYKGAPANSFVTATTSRYPLDAGGTIITFGLDLDNDTCSCYMDGLAMIEDQAFALNGSEDDSVLWYVKSFQGAVITLPTTITYPIEGYTVWK